MTNHVSLGFYGVIEAILFLLYEQEVDKEELASGWVIYDGDIYLNGAQVAYQWRQSKTAHSIQVRSI